MTVPYEELRNDGDFRRDQIVMPFYIILDLSGSMAGDLGALQRSTAELVAKLAVDPIIDDTIELSIIGFGSSAQVLVPMGRVSEISVPASFTTMGGTSFGKAWETYADALQKDHQSFNRQGARMFRPCVFFLTDGQPTDSRWREDFERFAGSSETNKTWPYVIAFGFRDASEHVLSRVAYPDFGAKRGKWFLTKDSDVGDLLKAAFDVIGNTIVTAGYTPTTSAGPAGASIPVPEVPADGRFTGGDAVDQWF